MKKDKRLSLIRAIILQGNVGNQRNLMHLFEKMGVTTTQATLSRDLKALGVATIHHPTKGNIYSLPHALSDHAPKPALLPLEAIRSMAFSGNLVVMKCIPSYAPSIAMALDTSSLDEIMGTVAGDDTVLIVLDEAVTRVRFQQALARQFGGIEKLFRS